MENPISIEQPNLQNAYNSLTFLDLNKELNEFITQFSTIINKNNKCDEFVNTYKKLTISSLLKSKKFKLQSMRQLISNTALNVLFQIYQLSNKEFNLQSPLSHQSKVNSKPENIQQNTVIQSNNEEEVCTQIQPNNNQIHSQRERINKDILSEQKVEKKVHEIQQKKEEQDEEDEQQQQEQERVNSIPKYKESEYGYDMIIKMKSIFDLQNIQTMGEHSIKGLKVESFKEQLDPNIENAIIVGMQGQRNKGKTFILNLLINEDFPSDYHLSTSGMCIKLHRLHNKNLVYVDTEGLGYPITIDYDKNEHYLKFMENRMDKGQVDIAIQDNLSIDIQNRHQDLKATEQIQQEFIVDSANILIIVVSYLTLDDQKLIHSISQKFASERNNGKQKKLLVIHNLKEYRKPEYVKDYIQELKKIFPIAEIPINNYEKTYEDENNLIFVDNVNQHINHLFMGYQKSNAGRVYNKFALYYLKFVIQMHQETFHFNIQQKLMDYLEKNLQNYVILQKLSDDAKQNPIISDFLEFNKENKAIILKKGYIIEKVKELQVNVLGSLQKDCYYSIVNNDEKKERYLFIEIPGNSKILIQFNKKQGELYLKVQQNSRIEEEHGEIQVTTRKLEEKQFKIQICKEKELWKIHKNLTNNLKNGIYQFVFTQEIDDELQ